MTPKKTALKAQEHRLKKGVKLEQIANNTKISTRFLTAIESEEFETARRRFRYQLHPAIRGSGQLSRR